MISVLACALVAQSLVAAPVVDVETSKTFDMRRPRAEDYASGPKPSRRVRAVLWGVTHNHALRVHRLSLQACNIDVK